MRVTKTVGLICTGQAHRNLNYLCICKVFFYNLQKCLLFVNRTKAFWSSRSNWGIGCQRKKDNVKIHTVPARCGLQQDYVFDEFLPTNLSDFNFCGLTNITQILDLAWVATTDKYIGFWVIFFYFLYFLPSIIWLNLLKHLYFRPLHWQKDIRIYLDFFFECAHLCILTNLVSYLGVDNDKKCKKYFLFIF